MTNFDPRELRHIAWEYCKLKSRTNKKHVSIITRGDMIESIACNSFEVPERYAHRGYRSTHSEVAAFMKLNCKRDNLVLYNYRFNNYGFIMMSKPCKTCTPWVDALFDSCWYSVETKEEYKLLGA